MARDGSDGKPEVSVVVLAYESGPLLARCLAALKAQTYRDFEVVLADNASSDGAPQAAAAAAWGAPSEEALSASTTSKSR